MAESLVLTGAEYVTDLTGVVWLNIADRGRLRIQVQETNESDIFEVLDEICPNGKAWKVRIGITISQTDE